MTRPSSKALSESLGNALNPPAKRKPARATNLADYDDEPIAPLPPSDGQTPPVPLPTPPIAPARDFNKRANSIERDALPSGMFPGSSKKIYDALYLRTRGAIKPNRSIQATKKDIMEWSGVKNRKTIDGHLRYLETCGLVVRQWELGNVEGYLYELRLPEEALEGRGGHRDSDGQTPTGQKTDGGTDQKRGTDGQSQAVELKRYTAEAKTSYKTNTERSDDDAVLAGLFAVIKTTSKEITGKELSSADGERWKELAEVLMAELRIAAARTTVSNVPAFLAEHLRRRLWKIDKKQARAEGRELPDEMTTKPQSIVETSSCPDCGGGGWWYPEGESKGVAKCKHEKLTIKG
jgi:hypothetical protein